MNRMRTGSMSRSFLLILAIAGCVTTSWLAHAQSPPHLNVIVPGGFPGMPIMLGIDRTTNGVAISWDGPSGYYQLYQKPALDGQVWQKFGGVNLNRTTNF